MRRLLDSLEALSQSDDSFRQAVENVLADVRSAENPHGNLAENLIASLDACCDGSKPVEQIVEDHQCLRQPLLHRQAASRPTLRRAMALTWFITRHMLPPEPGEADVAYHSEVDAWKRRLQTEQQSTRQTGTLFGRTGEAGQPCWWTFDEPGRAEEWDGWRYAHELALGPRAHFQARLDEALVEVSMDGRCPEPLFKPTALEGFGPSTLFRPELSGADHGRTVPVEPGWLGRPEVVSASQAYHDVVATTREIEVRVLPYREPT